MRCRQFISVSLVIFLMSLFLAASLQIALAASYVVTNTNDDGVGSLRKAIQDANSNPGSDTITFDTTAFPAGYPATIILGSKLVLSDIIGGTTIEGDGRVILTRAATTDRWECIEVRSNDNIIRGLQIQGFWVGIQFVRGDITENNIIGGTNPSQRNIISNNEHMGISLDGPRNANNLIIGNYIGLNPSGTAAWGNQATGVSIDHGAHNNIIGGTTLADRNIISGNTWVGVYMSDTTSEGTTNNHVRGNYIGTDYTGMLAIPNNQGGVSIDLNATGNTIGGTMPGAGNVISGHTGATPHGIRISQTSGNYVYGNIIGLTANGTASLENGRGIQLEYGANNNFIGGTVANMRNIISGEGNAGICLYESNYNTIQGNYIGTDIEGTKAIGPDYAGIIVDSSANNLIGGTVAGARNLISGNHYYGIHIYDTDSTNNTIVGNYIGSDTTGTLSLGNQNDGVRMGGNATNNIIGGATAGARNVISGNLHYGVAIQHAGTTGNQILGNYIGTDYSGTLDLGNGEIGIILDESPSGNIIGGTAVGAGNLISGNEGTGIQIGNFASYTLVLGNLIGTDKTGTAAIPNASAGGGYGIMIGGRADNNTVGGNTPGALNVISGNSRANNGMGVGILSDAKNNLITGNYIGTDITGTAVLGNDFGIHIWCAQNNTISKNVIHYNTVRGVNVDNVGAINNKITQNSITGNDGTAPEGGIWLANGANQGILPPVITSVTSNTVIGTTSAPDGSVVEIFQDTGCQGDVYIGSATVFANNFTFTGSAPSGATGGNLAATVTNPVGSTSRFSVPVVNNLGTSSPPEEQIEEIRDIFDDAISTGHLVGEGPGSSAGGRLKALGNMLERAEELIDQGSIVEAIQQLEDTYKRVDGNRKPPDFATGSEASALAEMIQNLIDNLRNR